MSQYRSSVILVLVVFLLGGGLWWYLTRDTRRINKRFETMVEQFSKAGHEADIDQLTKTAVVAGTFSHPLEMGFKGETYSIGEDELKGGIHELRSGARQIEIVIHERSLVLDRGTQRALMEIKASLNVEGNVLEIPDEATILIEWEKGQKSGDWQIVKVVVNTPSSID